MRRCPWSSTFPGLHLFNRKLTGCVRNFIRPAHANLCGPDQIPHTTFLQRFVHHPTVYSHTRYLHSGIDRILRDLPPLPIHEILVEPPISHTHQHLLPLQQQLCPSWFIRSPPRLLCPSECGRSFLAPRSLGQLEKRAHRPSDRRPHAEHRQVRPHPTESKAPNLEERSERGSVPLREGGKRAQGDKARGRLQGKHLARTNPQEGLGNRRRRTRFFRYPPRWLVVPFAHGRNRLGRGAGEDQGGHLLRSVD